MALIKGGGVIGELSGKLAGMVFARNKGGAYIRQYVVPTDPNTIAQVTARTAFGFSSSSYHSLSDTAKAAWQDFASYTYLPKSGTNDGQFSGFNAFVALANTARNSQLKNNGSGYADITTGTPYPGQTVGNFSISLVPPSERIQANILAASGIPIPMTVESTTEMNNSGLVKVVIGWSGGLGPSGNPVNLPLSDGLGNKIGFSVFVSNPVQQAHMFIQKPEYYQAGTIAPLLTKTSPDSIDSGISFTTQIPDLAIYKSFPVTGNYVRISVYAVSENGQQIRIGAVTSKVVATP